jgi:phosphatidate cytidylyltransferase
VLPARSATALVLAPTVIALVVVGDPWYSLAVALASAIGSWELHRLLHAAGLRAPLPLHVALSLTVLGAVSLGTDVAFLGAVALAAVAPALAGLGRGGTPDERIKTWASAALSVLYMGWLPAHFLLLRRIQGAAVPVDGFPIALQAGARWVILALLLTWCSDIFAYAAGKALGRHHMAPATSPGKTWEGTAAGAAACALVSYPLAALLRLPLGLLEGALLGAGLAVVGQVGDLAESLLKRAAGAKDSSTLMPGHGGLLDRIDSLLFTITFMYHYVLSLKA